MILKRRQFHIPSQKFCPALAALATKPPAPELPLQLSPDAALYLAGINREPPMTHAATPELDAEERPFWPAVRRGWHRRCPDCGQGPMMRGYLTVRDSCPVCGTELHHHRADDGPAYVTILIVGHILAPLILLVYSHWRPEPWTMVAMFSTGTVALSLYLLPRLKGAFVALQWSKKMHGFGNGDPHDAPYDN
jgi:uncharacterized protein (DUF983 family)